MSPLSSPGALQAAQAFCLARWRERAEEQGRRPPQDLAGACQFCALFAQALFGGEIRANWFHTWLVVDGEVVDLTDASGVSSEQSAGYDGTPFFRPWHTFRGPYVPDAAIEGSADFRDSLAACRERVAVWLSAWPSF